MAELEYAPLAKLETLADDYLRLDTIAQMKTNNGMPRELYVNFWIVNQFLNDNNENPAFPVERDEFERRIADTVKRAADLCEAHYDRNSVELQEAFKRVTSLEFHDADKRAELEKKMRDLGTPID